MTIGFRLPPAAAERVAFSYSPAMEAVLSLHVLVEPKHHPVQHEWVRAMRRLSPALKREIDTLAFVYRAYFPEFFFPPPAGELSDFAAELRRLRGFDEHLVRLEFAIALLEAQAAEGITRDPAALERPATRRLLREGAAHVRVNCDPPWPLGLVFPASSIVRESRPRIPPAQLTGVLRALADDTRLRALRLIAERPRSTQELAPLVGVTEAALSKHLRTLAEAGLLERHRDGYYVLYLIVPGQVAALAPSLEAFLAPQPPAGSGA